MAKEPIKAIIRRKPIVRDLAWLLKETRVSKGITQEELAIDLGMTRQAYSAIESGRGKRLDIVKVNEIINHCGEQLIMTTTLDNHQSSGNSILEDDLLLDFAEGRISEANAGLKELRYASYPPEKMYAKCKRNLGIAISAYFNQQPSQSHQLMTDVVMGLAQIGCFTEADEIRELYQRVIYEGEAAMKIDSQEQSEWRSDQLSERVEAEPEKLNEATVGDTIVVDDVAYTLQSVALMEEQTDFVGMKGKIAVKINYLMDNRGKSDLMLGSDLRVYGPDGNLSVCHSNLGGAIGAGTKRNVEQDVILNELGQIDICFRSQINLEKTAKFIAEV